MDKKIDEESKFADFLEKRIVWVVWFVLLAWFVCAVFAYILPDNNKGVFGDTFGSVNALFSGLAFVGLIYAIILQSKAIKMQSRDIEKQTEMLELQKEELKLQREELELTRGVLSEQKDQMKEQAQALQKQNFEETFFNLIRLHNEIVGSLRYPVKGQGDSYGVESLGYMYNGLKDKFGRFRSRPDKSNVERELTIEFCDEYFEQHRHSYSRYFQNLLVLLQFVDEYTGKNKDMYVDIIRAQLSKVELTFLLYYCLSMKGKRTIKPFIKDYNILGELSRADLVNPDHLAYF